MATGNAQHPKANRSGTARITWICEVCGKPIKGDTGYLEIVNLDPKRGIIGSWPRVPARGWRCKPGEPKGMRLVPLKESVENARRQEGKRNIGFKVVHARCDPLDHLDGYWITTDRLDSSEEWLDTLRHVAAKPWMDRDDIIAMMDLWPWHWTDSKKPTAGKLGLEWEYRWKLATDDQHASQGNEKGDSK